MNIKFSYYYGKEADQYSFFKIPKILYTDSIFKTLSSDAKVLYAILLDRMSLSMKNGWLDEENKVFIIFTIDEIEETMNIGRNKAINIMKEIQDFGLIEKKRRGLGKPNIIYVKSFLVETKEENRTAEEETSEDRSLNVKFQEVSKANLQKFEKQTSRNLENKPQELSLVVRPLRISHRASPVAPAHRRRATHPSQKAMRTTARTSAYIAPAIHQRAADRPLAADRGKPRCPRRAASPAKVN